MVSQMVGRGALFVGQQAFLILQKYLNFRHKFHKNLKSTLKAYKIQLNVAMGLENVYISLWWADMLSMLRTTGLEEVRVKSERNGKDISHRFF